MIQQTTLFDSNGFRIAHIWPEANGWVISWLVPPEAVVMLALRDPSVPILRDHTNRSWTGSELIAFLDTLPFNQRRYHQIGGWGS